MFLSRRKTACLVNSCFSETTKDSIAIAWFDSAIKSGLCRKSESETPLFKQAGGNTGNSVIGYSINKALVSAGIKVIGNYPVLPNSREQWADFIELSRNSDFIILCLQDLIRPDANQVWNDIYFSNLEKLSELCVGKLCIVSLGSNYIQDSEACAEEIMKLLPENVLNALTKLVNSAKYIQTRDYQLAEALQTFSRASQVKFLPAGCPSFLWKSLDKKKLSRNLSQLYLQKRISRILVGGLYGSKSLEVISKLSFIAQEQAELLPSDFLFCTSSGTHSHPFYIHAAVAIYASKSVKCFFHPEDWSKYIKQQNFSWYVGTRLHGGIMALMNHVPSVFTSGDQRVCRFASTFALPHCPRGLFVEDAIEVLMKWDYESTVRRQNDASRDFIKALGGMR